MTENLGAGGDWHPRWEWGEEGWPEEPRDTEDFRAMDEVPVAVLPECARCGEDHEDIKFKRLERPATFEGYRGGPVTHWAPCPTNGDPILCDWQDA